jgi:hypothetical protein
MKEETGQGRCSYITQQRKKKLLQEENLSLKESKGEEGMGGGMYGRT